MSKLLTLLILVSLLGSACTKQTVVDTGTAKAKFDGNMLQYLQSDNYNWELTVEMIERAGITDLFEGTVDSMPDITFFGPTSYSILRHLYDNGMESVSELSPEECRDIILKHVVKGKYVKSDFAYRDKQYFVFDPEQTGFTALITVGGNDLRAYLEKTSFQDNISDAGPVLMYLYSMSRGIQVPIASPDIQPDNGVVHSLNYNYILGNI